MFSRLHLLLAAAWVAVVFSEGHALCANATIGDRPYYTFKEQVPPRVIRDWDGEQVKLALVPIPCLLTGAEAEVCVDGPTKPDVKFREDLTDFQNICNILIVHVDGKIPGQHIPLHVKGARLCLSLP